MCHWWTFSGAFIYWKKNCFASCLAKGTKHKHNVFWRVMCTIKRKCWTGSHSLTACTALLYFTAQAEVFPQGKGPAVRVLHAGGGEDCSVLPHTEWLETRSCYWQLLPESRPLLQGLHENLGGSQEAGAALQQIQRRVLKRGILLLLFYFDLANQ